MEIWKEPPASGSIKRPKIGFESNRGQHIQSIEPDDDVKAAVSVSPRRPYSRIGGGFHKSRATQIRVGPIDGHHAMRRAATKGDSDEVAVRYRPEGAEPGELRRPNEV